MPLVEVRNHLSEALKIIQEDLARTIFTDISNLFAITVPTFLKLQAANIETREHLPGQHPVYGWMDNGRGIGTIRGITQYKANEVSAPDPGWDFPDNLQVTSHFRDGLEAGTVEIPWISKIVHKFASEPDRYLIHDITHNQTKVCWGEDNNLVLFFSLDASTVIAFLVKTPPSPASVPHIPTPSPETTKPTSRRESASLLQDIFSKPKNRPGVIPVAIGTALTTTLLIRSVLDGRLILAPSELTAFFSSAWGLLLVTVVASLSGGLLAYRSRTR